MKFLLQKAPTIKRAFAQAAWRVLRVLPISSRVLGPPRGVVHSTRDWCEKNQRSGARFIPLLSAREHHVFPEQNSLSEWNSTASEFLADRLLLDPREVRLVEPETFAAVIPRGRICSDGLVLTPDDKVLGDVIYQTGLAQQGGFRLPILQTFQLPKLQRRAGEVAVLSCLWSSNYFHWMFEVLPRWELLRRAGLQPECYVVSNRQHFQRETLQILGIAPEQIIVENPALHLESERLLLPSLAGRQGRPTALAVQFLRESLGAWVHAQSPENATSQSRPRLYISRSSAQQRRVINEDEVVRVLRSLGFEVVHPETLSVAEQIQLFNRAQAIVALHGAALSNLAFCQPDAYVVELLVPGWIHPLFRIIASHVGMHYAQLLSASAAFPVGEPMRENDASHQNDDVHIDVKKLRALIHQLEETL